MKRVAFAIPLLSLILLGAGCSLPGLGGPQTAKGPDGGLWRSSTGGASWAQAVALPGPKGVGSLANVNVLSFEQDPSDANVAYLGTRENGLFVTEDATASWRQPYAADLHAGAIASIAVDPKAACTIYVAKGPHLLKSADCLRTVDDQAYVETRANVNVSAVAVDWFNTNVVWIGLDNGDVLKSADGAKTWRVADATKAPVSVIRVSNADSRVVLVGTSRAGFFRTTDGGGTWNSDPNSLKNFRNATKVLSLSQDKAGDVLIAATGYGLLRSTDFGATWEGLTLLTAPGQVTIQAVAVEPGNANHVAYATPGTFYRTTDGGKTWNTGILPSARIPTVMRIDPQNPSLIYVGVSAK
jgi:photosystem II stability/assembly factor-like uncharacterized protein